MTVSHEIFYYQVPLSDEFTELLLIPVSDVHYGNALFSGAHLERTLQFLAETPNAYCILNGDLCESSLRTSRGEIYRQVGSPQDQRDWICERLSPVSHKILGMCTGNHEVRIYNEVGIDISLDIARELGVPYRAEGIYLKVTFGHGYERHDDKPYVFWLYATHGYGGARTKAAKAIKVERLASWVKSDVFIMSHDHEVNASPNLQLFPDNRLCEQKDKDGNPTGFTIGRVQERRQVMVKSNAYVKWGGYAEMQGFAPVDLTTPVIKLLTPKSPLWEMLPDKPHQAVRAEV